MFAKKKILSKQLIYIRKRRIQKQRHLSRYKTTNPQRAYRKYVSVELGSMDNNQKNRPRNKRFSKKSTNHEHSISNGQIKSQMKNYTNDLRLKNGFKKSKEKKNKLIFDMDILKRLPENCPARNRQNAQRKAHRKRLQYYI